VPHVIGILLLSALVAMDLFSAITNWRRAWIGTGPSACCPWMVPLIPYGVLSFALLDASDQAKLTVFLVLALYHILFQIVIPVTWDRATNGGGGPLHHAVDQGDHATLEMLLERGEDPDRKAS